MKQKLILGLPVGTGYGWGHCGMYFASHLTDHFEVVLVNHERTRAEMARCFADANLTPPDQIIGSDNLNGFVYCKDGLVLSGVANDKFENYYPVRGKKTGGLYFLENPTEGARWAEFRHRQPWDFLISGSTWGAKALESGPTRVYTAIQGIDERIFYPTEPPPHDGAIHVFSGGKYEYRKGQDIVLAAFAEFKKQHLTAVLHGAWGNQWGQSAKSMEQSPYLNRQSQEPAFNQLHEIQMDCAHFGLKVGLDVKVYQSLTQQGLANVMRKCHLGVFPNRCEGGTNLVLMEAIACGLPCFALNTTGHRDLSKFVAPIPSLTDRRESKCVVGSAKFYEANPMGLADVMQNWKSVSPLLSCLAPEFIANFNWKTRTAKLADIIRKEMWSAL